MKRTIIILLITLIFCSCGQKKEWKNVKNENTISAYESFLEKYPESKYADSASVRIDDIIWENVVSENTITAYESFLEKYPHGRYADSAKVIIEEIYFKAVVDYNTASAYEAFLKKFPQGKFADKAKAKIKEFPKLEKLYKQTYVTSTINNVYGQPVKSNSNNGQRIIEYIWDGSWIDRVYIDFYVRNTRGSGESEISITCGETKKKTLNFTVDKTYRIRAIIKAGETGPWNMTQWSQYQVVLQTNSFRDILTFQAPSGRMNISNIYLENY